MNLESYSLFAIFEIEGDETLTFRGYHETEEEAIAKIPNDYGTYTILKTYHKK